MDLILSLVLFLVVMGIISRGRLHPRMRRERTLKERFLSSAHDENKTTDPRYSCLPINVFYSGDD